MRNAVESMVMATRECTMGEEAHALITEFYRGPTSAISNDDTLMIPWGYNRVSMPIGIGGRYSRVPPYHDQLASGYALFHHMAATSNQ